MPFYTYAGPAGSYKTATAILDQCVEAIQSGRLVVTNIRGLQPDRVLAVFGNPNDISPQKAKNNFVHIGDISSEQARERLRYFYRWLPKGALLVIDEGQSVFRKDVVLKNYTYANYCKKKIGEDKLIHYCLQNYPDNVWFSSNINKIKDNFLKYIGEQGDIDEESDKWITYAQSILGRPNSLLDALDMHRHHGWDAIFTMTNIKFLHPNVLGNVETSYQHKNLSRFGFGGKYVQKVFDTQASLSTPENTMTRTIDKRVFQLYQSTATGSFSDSKQASSLFSFKLFFWLAVVLSLVIAVFWFADFRMLGSIFSGDMQGILKSGENKLEDKKDVKSSSNVGSSNSDQAKPQSGIPSVVPSPSQLLPQGSPPQPIDAKGNKVSGVSSVSSKDVSKPTKTTLSEYAQAHRQAAPALRGMDSGIRFVRLAQFDVPESLVTRFLYVVGVMSVGSEHFYMFAFDTPEGWKLLKQRDFDVSGLLIRPDTRGRSDIWEVLNENSKILGKITRPPYGWEVDSQSRQKTKTPDPVKVYGDAVTDGLGGQAVVKSVSASSQHQPIEKPKEK